MTITKEDQKEITKPTPMTLNQFATKYPKYFTSLSDERKAELEVTIADNSEAEVANAMNDVIQEDHPMVRMLAAHGITGFAKLK
jgi:hypothetical protein